MKEGKKERKTSSPRWGVDGADGEDEMLKAESRVKWDWIELEWMKWNEMNLFQMSCIEAGEWSEVEWSEMD